MSEKLSIRVQIGGRHYPLSIAPEEEEIIRRAAKLLNERMKSYRENFAVQDTQDLLSMCALEFGVRMLETEQNKAESLSEELVKQLTQTEQFISGFLNSL
jgi:cell division protein ZapA